MSTFDFLQQRSAPSASFSKKLKHFISDRVEESFEVAKHDKEFLEYEETYKKNADLLEETLSLEQWRLLEDAMIAISAQNSIEAEAGYIAGLRDGIALMHGGLFEAIWPDAREGKGNGC